MDDKQLHVEIERKFLVTDSSYKDLSYSAHRIRQGYLCSDRGRTVRIRVRDEEAFITIKGPSADGGLSRYEFEQSIPMADALKLLTMCQPGLIDKTRWLVKSGRHTFEVDEFHGDNEGLVMAEVELNADDEEYVKPAFVGREVTGDRRYYNSQLRQNPYKSWTQEQ